MPNWKVDCTFDDVKASLDASLMKRARDQVHEKAKAAPPYNFSGSPSHVSVPALGPAPKKLGRWAAAAQKRAERTEEAGGK